MREVRHENLVPFLGACVDTGSVFILTPYFSRGNLNDVLGNEDYRIDNMFTASLVADLIKVGFARSTNKQDSKLSLRCTLLLRTEKKGLKSCYNVIT